MRVLKVYIIEDQRSRRKKIKEYFESVNSLLSGNPFNKSKDYEDCHKCFKQRGYDKVEIIEITPYGKRDKDCDYNFKEESKWVKDIGNIIKNKEKEDRIFLMDFALNSEERKVFQISESVFIAKTARKILNYINENSKCKEYVLYESILDKIENRYRDVLCIDNEEEELPNIVSDCILGDYFMGGLAPRERANGISEAFDSILEKMNGG